MISNLDFSELAVLGLLAFAIYRGFQIKDQKYKHSVYVLMAGAALVLNSSTKNTETLDSADAATYSPSLSNFDAMELITIAAIGYGAYGLYMSGDNIGAACAAGAGLFGLYQGADVDTTF